MTLGYIQNKMGIRQWILNRVLRSDNRKLYLCLPAAISFIKSISSPNNALCHARTLESCLSSMAMLIMLPDHEDLDPILNIISYSYEAQHKLASTPSKAHRVATVAAHLSCTPFSRSICPASSEDLRDHRPSAESIRGRSRYPYPIGGCKLRA